MSIRWSAWVPWLRRRHPLGASVRQLAPTVHPSTPGTAGTDGRNQGKPDVVRPCARAAAAFPMHPDLRPCGAVRGGHLCEQITRHAWHRCACLVPARWVARTGGSRG